MTSSQRGDVSFQKNLSNSNQIISSNNNNWFVNMMCMPFNCGFNRTKTPTVCEYELQNSTPIMMKEFINTTEYK